MGRKRDIASRMGVSRRAASDYFLSPPPIFYREAILQQCEASYTPRCDSEQTPVRPANDTPHLPPSSQPAHRQQPTAHNPHQSPPATGYRPHSSPAHRPQSSPTLYFPTIRLPATDFRLLDSGFRLLDTGYRLLIPPTDYCPQPTILTGYRLPTSRPPQTAHSPQSPIPNPHLPIPSSLGSGL